MTHPLNVREDFANVGVIDLQSQNVRGDCKPFDGVGIFQGFFQGKITETAAKCALTRICKYASLILTHCTLFSTSSNFHLAVLVCKGNFKSLVLVIQFEIFDIFGYFGNKKQGLHQPLLHSAHFRVCRFAFFSNNHILWYCLLL